MDALVKLSAAGRPLGELLVWRGFGALPFLILFTAANGGHAALRPRSWRFVLGRGMILALGTLLFFWSLGRLSLATAYVTAFTAPLMLTALAVGAGNERVGVRTWVGLSAGFTGVMVAAAPGGADLTGAASLPGLAALVATFLYALGLSLVRYGRGAAEAPGALVLGALLATGTLGAALIVIDGGGMPKHAAADLVRLAAVAALAGASQILVTLAFKRAAASQLAPCEYLTLPLGAALGYLGWGDVPGPATLAGTALVAASVAWTSRRDV